MCWGLRVYESKQRHGSTPYTHRFFFSSFRWIKRVFAVEPFALAHIYLLPLHQTDKHIEAHTECVKARCRERTKKNRQSLLHNIWHGENVECAHTKWSFFCLGTVHLVMALWTTRYEWMNEWKRMGRMRRWWCCSCLFTIHCVLIFPFIKCTHRHISVYRNGKITHRQAGRQAGRRTTDWLDREHAVSPLHSGQSAE